MKTGPRTLFPKAHETQIEMTKIIGRNYKVNFRALGGDLISCFGNDGASLCQTWVPELAKEGSPHCPWEMFPNHLLEGRGSIWGGQRGGKKRDARESESWQAQKTGAWRSFVQGHWLSPDSVFPTLAFQLPWLH